jgi:hypothetical protein
MQTQEGRSLAMQKVTSFKSRVVEANKHWGLQQFLLMTTVQQLYYRSTTIL